MSDKTMKIFEAREDMCRDPALPERVVEIRIEDGALRFVGPDGVVAIEQVHRDLLLAIGRAFINAAFDLVP